MNGDVVEEGVGREGWPTTRRAPVAVAAKGAAVAAVAVVAKDADVVMPQSALLPRSRLRSQMT